jgi:23S rRNA pseudouridine1911/1915/1917 synthase
MSIKNSIEVPEEYSDERIDIYLAQALDESRSAIQKWIKEDLVQVNSKKIKANYLLKEKDRIEYTPKEPETIDISPEDIEFGILFEDNDIIVINKPAGLIVHPGAGNYSGTLVNALLYHQKALSSSDSQRPGIIHRLDKDTSGVMVVAKNNKAHENIANQIKERSVIKKYVALVRGYLGEDEGILEFPIGRHPANRKKMAVVSINTGKAAKTEYKVLLRSNHKTLVECILHTGRTHQIRVHFAHIGHPIEGDPTYGKSRGKKQLLHSYYLEFDHPTTQERVSFTAPLPKWAKQAELAKTDN